MAVTAKADWIAREMQREMDAAQREKYADLLARVKPKAPSYYPPIELNASTGDVSVVMLPVTPAPGGYLDKREEEIAALYSRYNGADSGPEVLVALLLEYPDGSIRTAVVEGSFGAVCQAFPDVETLAAWKDHGVTEVWSWEIHEPTVDEAAIWQEGMSNLEFLRAKGKALTEASRKLVPIEQMPKVLQRERLSRTLSETV